MATQQQDAQAMPIDIHYNKLLDWMINRRHCGQQWQGSVQIIREKIHSAMVDMPEVEEITKILEGTNINYFHCIQIVELLKDTDSGKKNLFGQYSSQKMKDWAEIIRLYEKGDVYLGDAAQMLMRHVNYEIPALKKQIAKCQNTQKECDRKEADFLSQAAELRKKYDAMCKQMGIKGEKIKSELSALVADLPSVFEKIARSTRDLEKAVLYYRDFVNFIMRSQELGCDLVPVFTYVMQKGNTTTYEWRTGTPPEGVVENVIVIDTADEELLSTDEGIQIDWGDDGTAGLPEADIDFGASMDLDISEITLESGGVQASDDDDQTDVPVEPTPDTIEWEVIPQPQEKQEISHSSEQGLAKGEDALTLLDNPSTRNLFIDDILEIEAFLMQRLTEMKDDVNHGNVLSSSQFQNAPESVHTNTHSVEVMLTQVRDFLGQLTSVQIQHLMLIRNSPRYVERLKDSLKQTLTLADKMVFHEKEMAVKRQAAMDEQRELEPRLSIIIKRTKEMQKQMEAEISKKYKNRPVNIMGDINMI